MKNNNIDIEDINKLIENHNYPKNILSLKETFKRLYTLIYFDIRCVGWAEDMFKMACMHFKFNKEITTQYMPLCSCDKCNDKPSHYTKFSGFDNFNEMCRFDELLTEKWLKMLHTKNTYHSQEQKFVDSPEYCFFASKIGNYTPEIENHYDNDSMIRTTLTDDNNGLTIDMTMVNEKNEVNKSTHDCNEIINTTSNLYLSDDDFFPSNTSNSNDSNDDSNYSDFIDDDFIDDDFIDGDFIDDYKYTDKCEYEEDVNYHINDLFRGDEFENKK